LELVCVGILRAEFGRRETKALSKAMIQLAAAEAAARRTSTARQTVFGERIRDWMAALSPRGRFALGTVIGLALGLVTWSFWSLERIHFRNAHPSLCTVSDATEARWANSSPHPKVGDQVSTGILKLESGVIELTFASTAKVAVEGPAQFKLTGPNSMVLENGIIATEVPRRATGFTLKTPTATVMDLGTRFGANVNGDRASEVDVFQGKVELTALAAEGNPGGKWRLSQHMAMICDQRGTMEATALPETAFPQPNLIVEARPQNCGFDVAGRAALGDVPSDFGYWSGRAYSLVGPIQTIRPYSGKGMLQFSDDPSDGGGDSEVWQLVDLRPFKKLLESGTLEARLSTYFNRIHQGTGESSSKFGVTLVAYHGLPANPKSLWARRADASLALADKEAPVDDDPGTWEKIQVTAKLPTETDFVIVEIRAVGSRTTMAKTPIFPGHFADLVELKLCSPMRRSTIAVSR